MNLSWRFGIHIPPVGDTQERTWHRTHISPNDHFWSGQWGYPPKTEADTVQPNVYTCTNNRVNLHWEDYCQFVLKLTWLAKLHTDCWLENNTSENHIVHTLRRKWRFDRTNLGFCITSSHLLKLCVLHVGVSIFECREVCWLNYS